MRLCCATKMPTANHSLSTVVVPSSCLSSGKGEVMKTIRVFGMTTLVIAMGMGCESDAEKLRRLRLDEAMESLEVSRREQNIGQGPISLIVFADAPGNDNRNTNGEYVTLFNSGTAATDIGGWSLCDSPSHCFTFPCGASIPANGHVRLYTGSGRTTATSFYMGSGRAVWDNDHDTATLRNGETVIAQDIY